MTDARRAALKKAYQDAHTRLMSVLYTCDPYGAGEAAGAPDDEYEEEATALMVNLRGRRTRADVATAVAETIPGANEALVDAVSDEWMRFLRRTERPDNGSRTD